MNQTDTRFTGSIPETYDRYLGPMFFAPLPEDPPLYLQRVPYGHGDCAAIERDLGESGFSRIALESVVQRSRAPSARDAALGVCLGTPLRHEIAARDPRRLDDVVEAATRALQVAFGEDAIDGAMRAFVFTAKAAEALSCI